MRGSIRAVARGAALSRELFSEERSRVQTKIWIRVDAALIESAACPPADTGGRCVSPIRPIDRERILTDLVTAANDAAGLVMEIYRLGDHGTELKGPSDPVTRADREANALLLVRLGRAMPGVPIVAEESEPASYSGFEKEECALFVDPVDGTRDFIARNGEFCVMIGFAERGRATIGVLVCPALALTFAGIVERGAFCNGAPIRIGGASRLARARCGIERYERKESVDARLARLGCANLVDVGNAGRKGSRVAAGDIDLYADPSDAATKLWDACAPDALVTAAGGVFTDASGRPFDYRGAIVQGRGSLFANAVLHAEALETLGS
jgi:3'(2'), 5'-bisphosphate nucleotidase